MRRFPILCSALFLLASAGVSPAQTPEPTDLLPFQTLVSLEVRHPSKMAREILAALKGTAVEDLYYRLAKMRNETPTGNQFFGGDSVGMFGILFSPEMIAELGRFQGLAVALTGFTKEGQPEVVGLIHSGESNLPGFYMRGLLSFEMNKIVDEVEKVGIFRHAWLDFDRMNQGEVKWREQGPYMVFLPGVIALTSSKESARDVIQRYKKKATTPALSELRAFRDAAELRERPGLFLAADVAGLTRAMDDAAKTLGAIVKTPWDQFKIVAEPRAFVRIDASLTYAAGDLELLGQAKLNPEFKSLLVDLFPSKPVSLRTLAGVPAKIGTTITFGVDDPEPKFKRIIEIADALAIYLGWIEEEHPSKVLPQVEKLLGFSLGKDLLGKVSEITLVGDAAWPWPVYVVQARDEESAKWLQEKAMPQLFRLANPGQIEPKPKTIAGRVGVTSPALQSYRAGELLYVTVRDGMLEGLFAAVDRKQTWDKVEKNMAAVKALGDARGLVTVSPQAIPFGLLVVRDWRVAMMYQAAVQGAEEADPFVKLLAQTLETMKPLVFRITREANVMKMQARFEGIQQTAPKLIDGAIQRVIELERERRAGQKKP